MLHVALRSDHLVSVVLDFDGYPTAIDSEGRALFGITGPQFARERASDLLLREWSR